MFRQGAQLEASTVAARLPGLQLKEVGRSYTYNICVISLVVLTFILDIVLVGFLEISYNIPSMTCKVMEVYEGENLSNTEVYEFEHITKSGRMGVIRVSFSQPGWFDGSKAERNTTGLDNRMGYKKPFIPPKVTATCNTLNHTAIYSISLLASIVGYHHLYSQIMSTNGATPKSANMALLGGLFCTRQHRDDTLE